MKRAVTFADRHDVKAWLHALSEAVEDVADLGHEATKPSRTRVVSRAQLGADMGEAVAALRRLLRAGKRGAR